MKLAVSLTTCYVYGVQKTELTISYVILVEVIKCFT